MLLLPENLQNRFYSAIEHINKYFGKVCSVKRLKGLSNYNVLVKYISNNKTKHSIVLKILNLNAITENSNSKINNNMEDIYITPKILYNNFPYYYIIEYKQGIHPKTTYFNNINKIKALSDLLAKLHNINYSNFRDISYINFYDSNMLLLKQLNLNNKFVIELKNKLEYIFKQIKEFPITLGFCHNDLNNKNIIIDSYNKIWLIDFEYSGISDVFFDISSLKKLFTKSCYEQFLKYYHKNYLCKLTDADFYSKLDKYLLLSILTETTWYLYMSNQATDINNYYQNKFLKLFKNLNTKF